MYVFYWTGLKSKPGHVAEDEGWIPGKSILNLTFAALKRKPA
jgi:hypothetical protein